MNTISIIKRDGRREQAQFEKVQRRISAIAGDLENVNIASIAKDTIARIFDGIKSSQIDDITIEICNSLRTVHPEYDILAVRIWADNLRRQVPETFSAAMEKIASETKMFNPAAIEFIRKNADALNSMIVHERDELISYGGYLVLTNSYLAKVNGNQNSTTPVETPQYMYLRCAVQVGALAGFNDEFCDLAAVKRAYDYMSTLKYTHATPTLYNSCLNGQLDSCFLLGVNDSIEEIMKCVSNCSVISKKCGGIGVHMSNIRSHGQCINSMNGYACGVPRQMKIYEACAQAWDQGSKRPGAFAIYLDLWHGDLMEFLTMRLPSGDSANKTRGLHLALWIPELFIKRWRADKKNATWSLFSVDTAPNLDNVYGREFEELYEKYERDGLAVDTVKINDIIRAIRVSIQLSGEPYLLNRDAANEKSNQSNIGVIKSSNLCTEIFEVSTHDKYATCTLASIAVSAFASPTGYDFDELRRVAYHTCTMLDNVIEANKYPVPECEQWTKDTRPIGIGIQGLADAFAIMGYPYDSEEAEKLDAQIAETIYYGALEASAKLAEIRGQYKHYQGSPASRGILHFDHPDKSGLFEANIRKNMIQDWTSLRAKIAKSGLRQSLHLAFMPTASTSEIMGNNASIEPYYGMLFNKKMKIGVFVKINFYFVRDMIKYGLWNENMRNKIIAAGGDISEIAEIPQKLRDIYTTAMNIKPSALMRRAAVRGFFIDQGQSLNLYKSEITDSLIASILSAGEKYSLKTMSYYIHSKSAGSNMKINKSAESGEVCTMKDGCVSCGS